MTIRKFTVEMTTTVRYSIEVEVKIPEAVDPKYEDREEQTRELVHEAAWDQFRTSGFIDRMLRAGADEDTLIDDFYEEES